MHVVLRALHYYELLDLGTHIHTYQSNLGIGVKINRIVAFIKNIYYMYIVSFSWAVVQFSYSPGLM